MMKVEAAMKAGIGLDGDGYASSTTPTDAEEDAVGLKGQLQDATDEIEIADQMTHLRCMPRIRLKYH